MARLEGTPINWRTERRFVCIGGSIGRNVIPGLRLRELYKLRHDECWVFENDSDPRFEGGNLKIHPKMYTILRPVEAKPGSDHTAQGYGYPHIDIPLTIEIVSMMKRLKQYNWKDPVTMAVFADLLEDNDINDPRFPWILDALRDPAQSIYIPQKIWYGAFCKITLSTLLTGVQK